MFHDEKFQMNSRVELQFTKEVMNISKCYFTIISWYFCLILWANDTIFLTLIMPVCVLTFL